MKQTSTILKFELIDINIVSNGTTTGVPVNRVQSRINFNFSIKFVLIIHIFGIIMVIKRVQNNL